MISIFAWYKSSPSQANYIQNLNLKLNWKSLSFWFFENKLRMPGNNQGRYAFKIAVFMKALVFMPIVSNGKSFKARHSKIFQSSDWIFSDYLVQISEYSDLIGQWKIFKFEYIDQCNSMLLDWPEI